MLEVTDCSALPQELRVCNDGEVGRRICLLNDPFDLVACSDRHRRFRDDERETLQKASYFTSGGMHIA
jgi:hypothetical protein